MRRGAPLSEFGKKTLSFRPKKTAKKKRLKLPADPKKIKQALLTDRPAVPADFPSDLLAFGNALKTTKGAGLEKAIADARIGLPEMVKKHPGDALFVALALLRACKPEHPSFDGLIETCGNILPLIALNPFGGGVQAYQLLQAMSNTIEKPSAKKPSIFGTKTQDGVTEYLQGTVKIKNQTRAFIIADSITEWKKETGFALTTGDIRPTYGVLFIEGSDRFQTPKTMLKNRQLLRGHDVLPEAVHTVTTMMSGRPQPKAGCLSLRGNDHYSSFAQAAQKMTAPKTRRAMKPIGIAILERVQEKRAEIETARIEKERVAAEAKRKKAELEIKIPAFTQVTSPRYPQFRVRRRWIMKGEFTLP